MTEVSESVLTPLRFLERSAQVWSERPAVVSGERTFTYAEHHARIRRLAGALEQLGVEPGDRVATLLPNVIAMLELHYAVPGIGADPSTWMMSCRNCSDSATLGSSMFEADQSSLSAPVPFENSQGWMKKFWFGTS